jgi:hypothetical protein
LGGVQPLGDFLRDLVTAEHPVLHGALASTGGRIPVPSRHLRSSMRVR